MTNNPIHPDWIGVDWGTTHLRVWAMTDDGQSLAEARSDKDMGYLKVDEFEPALLDIIGSWLPARAMTVIVCGMAGSRQGWIEAPYATVPCPATATQMVTPRVADPRLQIHIIPGVKQPSPADVMRGAETQISGFLRLNPGFDGILCLPGTHTKWVRISESQISAFRTAMTGEIFGCLSRHTVLRHAVLDGAWNDDAFVASVSDAISRPEQLATQMFSLRADNLLNGTGSDITTARLSGMLIGAELASLRGYWLGQKITLIGAGGLCEIYSQALTAQGVETNLVGGDVMTRAGLFAAYEATKETTI